MFTVISYDIPDDRRRIRVAKLLLDYGQRVQYSVFEAYLEPAHLAEFYDRLRPLLNEDEDNVRVYRLCGECRWRVEVFGQKGITEKAEFYLF